MKKGLDGKIVFLKLLTFGFFPEKLTGVLTSKNFGEWVNINDGQINIPNSQRYSLMAYKLTRNNNAPRQMGVPHPLAFIRLCRKIRDFWPKIKLNFIKKSYSAKSMVCPSNDNKNGRLISMSSYDKNPEAEQMHLDNHFGKKYLVCADIATCYPSIYTHSISWALVGKNVSKKNQQNKEKWYNLLDSACSNMQDGETKGLPIGPDTSGLLAEVILSQVDEALKKYDYTRYIDDYRCSCRSKEEADAFIRDLSKALEKYRLNLNIKKTKVLNLPMALNQDWVRKLKQAITWKEINEKNKDSIIGFFDLASELFEKNPNDSPIRYAAQVLKKKKFTDYKTYKLVLRYFFNLYFLYPYVTDIADDLIYVGLKNFPKNWGEMQSILKKSFQIILKEHIKHMRSDVVVWVLFLMIKYNIKIEDFEIVSKEILKTKDCMPALLCYLYGKINGFSVSKFKLLINKVDENEWWLYIYEVCRIEKIKHSNTEMEKMRKAKVTFLERAITERL